MGLEAAIEGSIGTSASDFRGCALRGSWFCPSAKGKDGLDA